MTPLFVRKLVSLLAFACFGLVINLQATPGAVNKTSYARSDKPYKILTSGKQVIVKSSREIKSVIVWTATGHRIVEDKSVNSNSFSFNVSVAEKVFFIMIQYDGDKPYTEKIGLE